MRHWTHPLKAWLNVILESPCPLCQRSTAATFCLDCDRQLQRCALPAPAAQWQGQLPVFAWGKYGGTLKRVLAGLKYDYHPQVAQPLGQWLGQAWLKQGPKHLVHPTSAAPLPVVVPIPLHTAKLKQRGYNQAELLAQSFCEQTGLSLQRQGLVRIRATEAQFGLSQVAREQNLAAAFALNQSVWRGSRDRPVLLLDDIYTTGATVQSAAQTLRSQGIKVCGIIAIAQAQY
ncbi:ComF family protein [Trichocoleus sp. FACHB-262]|uniref:ComF family protein n=1 Tax=Trichocoleus sp. FACHB-262 TaxID=2692869 RepID=UPI00168209C3|nr:ComF family protein [Trichocoleus sp. FACHB-262]MBD2123364.1 ComF family protein [Trichocoleus sp. FACHB-262]